MAFITTFAAWLEATPLAGMVGESKWATAVLSASHVLGYVLVMGGALLGNLKLLIRFMPRLSVAEVLRPASQAILWGLLLGILTGIPLVSPRASTAFVNGIFLLKMLLLVSATLVHFAVQRWVIRRGVSDATLLSVLGSIGLTLWLGLALAAIAYILFE